MMTVKQICRLTGISVRTLHHYDAIGLLKPTTVTKVGYRLYDEAALQRLHAILFFRHLQFPLKQIKGILDSSGFDPKEAIAQQIELLELQKKHLEELIAHARQIQDTGVIPMNPSAFDTNEFERYTAQAREKWGSTDAYKEFAQKTAHVSPQQMRSTGDGLMDIFAQLGQLRHLSPDDSQVQALIGQLQGYITEHYYTCTKQILKGLGQMYIAGDEMTANIDTAGGEGTARFAHLAIEEYCK